MLLLRDGIPAVTDGPFAEAKEQMVGYCIVDCGTLPPPTTA